MLQSIKAGEELRIADNITHPANCCLKFKYNYISSAWHWVENNIGVQLIIAAVFLFWLNQCFWLTCVLDALEKLKGQQYYVN